MECLELGSATELIHTACELTELSEKWGKNGCRFMHASNNILGLELRIADGPIRGHLFSWMS